MANEGIISKIEKCLRLSKSSEPHEAAAALRQAQKLMQQYQITEDDLVGNKVHSTLVITTEPAQDRIPMYLVYLYNLVIRACGVDVVLERPVHGKGHRLAFRYFAVSQRSQLAAHAHVVCTRAMDKDWRAHLAKHPELYDARGARAGFRIGWILAVEKQVMEFGLTDDEAEITRKAIAKHYGEPLSEARHNQQKVRIESMAAGATAGGEFKMHRPMSGKVDEPLMLGSE